MAKSLIDILACPTCKTSIARFGDEVICSSCHRHYPIINNVPILFPDGGTPSIQHEHEIAAQSTYFPWVNRVVLQSLLDDQIVVEVGSGEMALDDPNIVRMDVKLTPHVDVVGDIHAFPFLPESVDYIFSLAVIEHLRQPFLAANQMYDALKDGGYVYHECNFVFAYHAFPYHFFNASMQGMEQIFSPFRILRQGIAPYQMPSCALQMVLLTYLHHSTLAQHPEAEGFRRLLEAVLESDLFEYDRYFEEKDAAYVAAGTFVFGLKQKFKDSLLIPPPIQRVWSRSHALQSRFPTPENIGTVDNILHWATNEGRTEFPEIDTYLNSITPFNKNGLLSSNRSTIRSFPFVEPTYGILYDFPTHAPPRKNPAAAEERRVRMAEELYARMHQIAEIAHKLEEGLDKQTKRAEALEERLERQDEHVHRLEEQIHQQADHAHTLEEQIHQHADHAHTLEEQIHQHADHAHTLEEQIHRQADHAHALEEHIRRQAERMTATDGTIHDTQQLLTQVGSQVQGISRSRIWRTLVAISSPFNTVLRLLRD